MSRPRFTKAEDAVLRKHYPKGGRTACKSHLPGRSETSIKQRVRRLGLTLGGPPSAHSKPPPERPGEAKTRACLKCREEFPSAWARERVCPRCKNGFAWRQALDEPVHAGRQV